MKTIVENNDNSNKNEGILYPSGGPGRHLKSGLANKTLMLGAMINEYSRPSLAKIYKEAGYDFLFIDYEHLFFDFESLYDTVLAARAYGLPPIAKTPQLERQEIAKLLILSKSAEWTARRAREAQELGQPQGPEGSLGKLVASNVARASANVHTLISGADAMLTGVDSAMNGIIAEILVSVPAISIAGGTDEIQRNIIAERVLGMPKEPRMDTGPFRDVPKNVIR